LRQQRLIAPGTAIVPGGQQATFVAVPRVVRIAGQHVPLTQRPLFLGQHFPSLQRLEHVHMDALLPPGTTTPHPSSLPHVHDIWLGWTVSLFGPLQHLWYAGL
jgi:hypothetical protein